MNRTTHEPLTRAAPSPPQVEGFPTILMFPAAAKGEAEKAAPVPYEGDQTLISLTRFIKAHATARARAGFAIARALRPRALRPLTDCIPAGCLPPPASCRNGWLSPPARRCSPRRCWFSKPRLSCAFVRHVFAASSLCALSPLLAQIPYELPKKTPGESPPPGAAGNGGAESGEAGRGREGGGGGDEEGEAVSGGRADREL